MQAGDSNLGNFLLQIYNSTLCQSTDMISLNHLKKESEILEGPFQNMSMANDYFKGSELKSCQSCTLDLNNWRP